MSIHLPFIYHISQNSLNKLQINTSSKKLNKKSNQNVCLYQSINQPHHQGIKIKSPFYSKLSYLKKPCQCPYHRMKRYKAIVFITKRSHNCIFQNQIDNYKQAIANSAKVVRQNNGINYDHSPFKQSSRFQRNTQGLPINFNSSRKKKRQRIDNYNKIFQQILRIRMRPLQDHQKVNNLIKFIKINANKDQKYLNKQRNYIYTQLHKVTQKVKLDAILMSTHTNPNPQIIHKVAHIIDANQDMAIDFIRGVQTAMNDFESFIIDRAKQKQIQSQKAEKLNSITNKVNNSTYENSENNSIIENKNNTYSKDNNENNENNGNKENKENIDNNDNKENKDSNENNNEKNSNNQDDKNNNNNDQNDNENKAINNNINARNFPQWKTHRSRNTYSYNQLTNRKTTQQKLVQMDEVHPIKQFDIKKQDDVNQQQKCQQQKLQAIKPQITPDKNEKANIFLPLISKDKKQGQDDIGIDHKKYKSDLLQIQKDIIIDKWESPSPRVSNTFQQKLEFQKLKNNINIANSTVQNSYVEIDQCKKVEDLDTIIKPNNKQKNKKQNVDKQSKQNTNKKKKYKKIKQSHKNNIRPQQQTSSYHFAQGNYDHIIAKEDAKQIQSIITNNENKISQVQQDKILQQLQQKLQNIQEFQQKLSHIFNEQQVQTLRKKYNQYKYNKLLNLLTKQVDACLFQLKTFDQNIIDRNQYQDDQLNNLNKIRQTQKKQKTILIQCSNSNQSLMDEFMKFKMITKNQIDFLQIPKQQQLQQTNLQQKQVGEILVQTIQSFNNQNQQNYNKTSNDDNQCQFNHGINRQKHLSILRYMKYKHSNVFNEIYDDVKDTLQNVTVQL